MTPGYDPEGVEGWGAIGPEDDGLGDVRAELTPRYGPLTVLGEGGMCRVFRGVDPRRGRPVAIKVLLPAARVDPQARMRFVRELKTLEGWRHPQIIELFDCALQPFPWYSMAYVEGFSLAEHLKRLGPMGLPEALEVARQVLAALAYVHEQGYLHRDLKPGNVLLDGEGRAFLADFGLVGKPEASGLTQMGMGGMGTFLYAPPEELAGMGQDVPGDLFSFGLLLFECVTGERYFEVDLDTMRRAPAQPLGEALAARDLGRLGPVLETLLAGDPRDRFQAAGEVRRALDAIAADQASADAFATLSELVHIDLVGFGPLLAQLELLARLSPEQRRLFLEDPGNLRDLRLPAWELRRRNLRFRGATDDTTVQGVEAWVLMAGDLLKVFEDMVQGDAWERVPEVRKVAEVTAQTLRQKLARARVEPVARCLEPLLRSLRRHVQLVLPDEEAPVYGWGDLDAIRAWLGGVLERALRACGAPGTQPAVYLQSSTDELTWVLDLKGRDVVASPGAVAEAVGPGPVEVVAGELGGGVRLRIPALLTG